MFKFILLFSVVTRASRSWSRRFWCCKLIDTGMKIRRTYHCNVLSLMREITLSSSNTMHTDHARQLALWNSKHSYSFYQIYDPSSPDLNQVDWPKLGKSTAASLSDESEWRRWTEAASDRCPEWLWRYVVVDNSIADWCIRHRAPHFQHLARFKPPGSGRTLLFTPLGLVRFKSTH